mmetsp:Transcript_26119/g.68708  ORF Transcript_26119/g.68708 Transcript_26119/m.68708 type:complete len:302 (+) Transcript_26119:155-1060(+)
MTDSGICLNVDTLTLRCSTTYDLRHDLHSKTTRDEVLVLSSPPLAVELDVQLRVVHLPSFSQRLDCFSSHQTVTPFVFDNLRPLREILTLVSPRSRCSGTVAVDYPHRNHRSAKFSPHSANLWPINLTVVMGVLIVGEICEERSHVFHCVRPRRRRRDHSNRFVANLLWCHGHQTGPCAECRREVLMQHLGNRDKLARGRCGLPRKVWKCGGRASLRGRNPDAFAHVRLLPGWPELAHAVLANDTPKRVSHHLHWLPRFHNCRLNCCFEGEEVLFGESLLTPLAPVVIQGQEIKIAREIVD